MIQGNTKSDFLNNVIADLEKSKAHKPFLNELNPVEQSEKDNFTASDKRLRCNLTF